MGALFMVCPLVVFNSCEKPEQGGGSTPEGTKVTFTLNRSKVLHNPLNGWVMYGSGNGDPSYWDKKMHISEEGSDVYVKDYASACYIRTNWTNFNPSRGVYSWRDKNSTLGKMINGALERGKPIAFRIVVDGRDQRQNTPQFVIDDGAKYWLENAKYPDRITPYPQDPVFQKHYETLIEELAKDFNDPKKCAFIDAYGLGKWGEGHNVCYEDNNAITSKTEELKYQVMDWITDVYSKNFTKIPLLINYHRVIGHPTSDGNVNENTEKLLNLCMSKGYSLRQDAFGMTDYYKSWERGYAATWRFKRPIVMEGGWIVNQHRYWIDGSGKYREGHPEDVRQGEYDECKLAKVNMMDFRVGDETESWFRDSYELVKKFVAEGGYRLYPDQFYVPEELKSGASCTIQHRWRNMGWGYFPNNIPQWNYRYKVAVALLDPKEEVALLVVDKDCEPSGWVDGNANTYKTKVTADVPAGNYTWAIAIVDTTDGNTPAIGLAVNANFSKDNWLKIKSVTIK
ncbi:MAG: DUF4832 domain-containing protein [Bacteroidales bacterium]|nr:DUF4832 domain-containing protein [Bacteroidales bacterium]